VTRPLVFLFPGQSSRDPSMFERLAALAPARTHVALAQFERIAGQPFTGAFETNLEIQLAVHLATAVWRELVADAGLQPIASAGLSLGEYAHLVEVGALGADEARELVGERGRCYDRGPDGAMAVVQPVGDDDLEAVLERVRDELDLHADDLAISNYNSPTQHVIAGRSDAVLRAAAVAEDELYAAATVIERRVPMHVRRFRPAAAAFVRHLERAAWSIPVRRWWSNVDGTAVARPRPAELVRRMYRHVFQPVRWRQLVDNLVAAHPGAVLVEVGPRSVLTDLLGRGRWLRDVTAIALDRASDSLPRRIEEVCRAVDA
jgi:[acyl-carrier-protein] S-malonyltransferase